VFSYLFLFYVLPCYSSETIDFAKLPEKKTDKNRFPDKQSLFRIVLNTNKEKTGYYDTT